MLEILPTLKDGYQLIPEELISSIKDSGNIKDDEMCIFIIPSKIIKKKVHFYKTGIFTHIPNIQKNNTSFSVDQENSSRILSISLRLASLANYKDFLLAYGSFNSKITIDGYIESTDKLTDYGFAIADAYITSKRDDLNYSEDVFNEEIDKKTNEGKISEYIKEYLGYENLNIYISKLKQMVSNKKIHKYKKNIQTDLIRGSFYDHFDLKEKEISCQLDLFLSTTDLLNYLDIVDVIGIRHDNEKEFDYFKDYEMRDSLEDDEFSLQVKFKDRFIKTFDI